MTTDMPIPPADDDAEVIEMKQDTLEEQREKVAFFLEKLADLQDETGVSIGGCGCCGSPYIDSFEYQVTVKHIDGDADYKRQLAKNLRLENQK